MDAYTELFEGLAFPLLDRLNGTSIAAKLQTLLASEHLDRAEIQNRQREKLAGVVEDARRSIPFYVDFWKKNGPRSVHPALDGLPVLTKADIAGHDIGPRNASFTGRTLATRTSGSTGSPMVFHRSMEQESWFWALRFRMWRWSGYHPGDPYLEINLNPRLAWKKRLQDHLFRCSYLTYNADNQDSARIVSSLREMGQPYVNGFSSSLFALGRYILETDGPRPTISGILSTGDTLHPSYRETIESAFGVRALDYYGAGGEGFHVASQCLESGSRYHIHPEDAVLEVLGEEGPAKPGTPGRIVATQLDNDAMPLVRYELGDVGVAAPDDAACTCGRTLPMLERVEGRIPDLVVAPSGAFLVTHFFVVLFKDIQEIGRYQVVQKAKDGICVRLVPRPEADREAIEKHVTKEVSDATRGTLACEFQWVDEIPLSGAGKRRLVVSDLGREALARVAA